MRCDELRMRQRKARAVVAFLDGLSFLRRGVARPLYIVGAARVADSAISRGPLQSGNHLNRSCYIIEGSKRAHPQIGRRDMRTDYNRPKPGHCARHDLRREAYPYYIKICIACGSFVPWLFRNLCIENLYRLLRGRSRDCRYPQARISITNGNVSGETQGLDWSWFHHLSRGGD
jgi:hypothetical protein